MKIMKKYTFGLLLAQVAALAYFTWFPTESLAFSLTKSALPQSSDQSNIVTYDFENGVLPNDGFVSYIPENSDSYEFWGASKGTWEGFANNNSTYLAVGAKQAVNSASYGSLTILVSSAVDYFGFWWGTADYYNKLSFFNGTNLIAQFDGTAVAPLTARGDYYNFNAQSVNENFNRIVMTSQRAFETDNNSFRVASSQQVPEPATCLLLAGGLVATRLRRKRA